MNHDADDDVDCGHDHLLCAACGATVVGCTRHHMGDPLHKSLVAEADALRARLAAVERERDEAIACNRDYAQKAIAYLADLMDKEWAWGQAIEALGMERAAHAATREASAVIVREANKAHARADAAEAKLAEVLGMRCDAGEHREP